MNATEYVKNAVDRGAKILGDSKNFLTLQWPNGLVETVGAGWETREAAPFPHVARPQTKLSDSRTKTDRELIDEAIAAGRVNRLPMESIPEKKHLVPTKGYGARMGRLRRGKR